MTLAREALIARLPATAIAEVLSVSSTTVYRWFRGGGVREEHRRRVQLLLDHIKQDRNTGVSPAKTSQAAIRYLKILATANRSAPKRQRHRIKLARKASSIGNSGGLIKETSYHAALRLVKHDGHRLDHLPSQLRAAKKIVLDAVKNDGRALEYASEHFRNDKEVVLTAIEADPNAYWEASERLQNDKDVYLAAITGDPEILEATFYSADKQVVMSVVNQHGLALQYAAEPLRDDRATVLLAVDNNGLALKYASSRLRRCRVIVSVAVMNDPDALQFAAAHLRKDPVVLASAKARAERIDRVYYAPITGSDDRELDDIINSLNFDPGNQ